MTATAVAEAPVAPPVDDGKITCMIDNGRCHSIPTYLKEKFPEWTLERYRETYPDAPVFSAFAAQRLAKIRADKEAANAAATSTAQLATHVTIAKAPLHEAFDLGGGAKAAFTATGNPIMIDVLQGCEPELQPYLATIDRNYVFPIELLKLTIFALQLNMPLYVWGMHGTGKTTLLEQASARTGRPFMRVQHTISTEESHILGQFVVRNQETQFQLGPLPLAMLFGAVYCADEYDFALPAVTSVYQPVLEGKNLIIKDAPEQFRVIRPHPNFRFVATGNTNGSGDETGLYQGTNIQNAANYSRFRTTFEVPYMDPKMEAAVVAAQSGVDLIAAGKFVQFAKLVRDGYADSKINMPISPRELISAGITGIAFGGDWQLGLRAAFGNRLNRIDQKVCEDLMQRVFA